MGGDHERLAELLRETGEHHHRAFRETDGADPEWPLWYAEHLHGRLGEVLPSEPTKSELVYLLIAAERERSGRAPDAEWSGYYAEFMTREAGAS